VLLPELRANLSNRLTSASATLTTSLPSNAAAHLRADLIGAKTPTAIFIAAHAAKKPATTLWPGAAAPAYGSHGDRRPTSSHHRVRETGRPGPAASCHHGHHGAAAAQKPRSGPSSPRCCHGHHHHARPPRATAATSCAVPMVARRVLPPPAWGHRPGDRAQLRL
jgi:hypothetical protein